MPLVTWWESSSLAGQCSHIQSLPHCPVSGAGNTKSRVTRSNSPTSTYGGIHYDVTSPSSVSISPVCSKYQWTGEPSVGVANSWQNIETLLEIWPPLHKNILKIDEDLKKFDTIFLIHSVHVYTRCFMPYFTFHVRDLLLVSFIRSMAPTPRSKPIEHLHKNSAAGLSQKNS